MIRIIVDHGMVVVKENGEYCLTAGTGSTIDGKFVPVGTVLATGDDVLVTRNNITVSSGPRDRRRHYSLKLAG